jgi:hypothetical protein
VLSTVGNAGSDGGCAIKLVADGGGVVGLAASDESCTLRLACGGGGAAKLAPEGLAGAGVSSNPEPAPASGPTAWLLAWSEARSEPVAAQQHTSSFTTSS